MLATKSWYIVKKSVSSNILKSCILFFLKSNSLWFCNTFHLQKWRQQWVPQSLLLCQFTYGHFRHITSVWLSQKNKETLNIATFFRYHIFYLDRRWRFIKVILAFCQKYSEYEVSHKIRNITIFQNNQFLRGLHNPKSANLIYHRLFKTYRHSHLP